MLLRIQMHARAFLDRARGVIKDLLCYPRLQKAGGIINYPQYLSEESPSFVCFLINKLCAVLQLITFL